MSSQIEALELFYERDAVERLHARHAQAPGSAVYSCRLGGDVPDTEIRRQRGHVDLRAVGGQGAGQNAGRQARVVKGGRRHQHRLDARRAQDGGVSHDMQVCVAGADQDDAGSGQRQGA